MLPVNGVVPGFVAVKDGKFPVPDAPMPMAGLSFVQEYEMRPPVSGEVKVAAAVVAPLQTV